MACKHRDEAYRLSRFIIEEIKKRSPIWKKEHYENEDNKFKLRKYEDSIKRNMIESINESLILYLQNLNY